MSIPTAPIVWSREPEDYLLTLPEVAEMLRMTPYALYTLRTRRQGPRGMTIGRRVLFRRGDVDAWLREREDERK